MKIQWLKNIRSNIQEGCYDAAVSYASLCGLHAWREVEEGNPNTCYTWYIRYDFPDGTSCDLLDAAYTTGNAGWYRSEGRWILGE